MLIEKKIKPLLLNYLFVVRYQTLQTEPLTASDTRILGRLQTSTIKYDFWSDPAPGRPVAVMSPPGKDLRNLKRFLWAHAINFQVIVEDVGR